MRDERENYNEKRREDDMQPKKETENLRQQIDQLQTQLEIQQEQKNFSSDEIFRWHLIKGIFSLREELVKIDDTLNKIGEVLIGKAEEETKEEIPKRRVEKALNEMNEEDQTREIRRRRRESEERDQEESNDEDISDREDEEVDKDDEEEQPRKKLGRPRKYGE